MFFSHPILSVCLSGNSWHSSQYKCLSVVASCWYSPTQHFCLGSGSCLYCGLHRFYWACHCVPNRLTPRLFSLTRPNVGQDASRYIWMRLSASVRISVHVSIHGYPWVVDSKIRSLQRMWYTREEQALVIGAFYSMNGFQQCVGGLLGTDIT